MANIIVRLWHTVQRFTPYGIRYTRRPERFKHLKAFPFCAVFRTLSLLLMGMIAAVTFAHDVYWRRYDARCNRGWRGQ